MRKTIAATVSAALCMLSVSPAIAQSYRPIGFDAPQGVTATANLRIPLGRESKARSKPTYGLTLGFGRTGGAGYDGRPIGYGAKVADLRFGMDGRMDRAQVASFNLANLDGDERLNLTGGNNTVWIVVGAIAAGAAICFVITDCFGDDNEDLN
jgi:hypothetical protein